MICIESFRRKLAKENPRKQQYVQWCAILRMLCTMVILYERILEGETLDHGILPQKTFRMYYKIPDTRFYIINFNPSVFQFKTRLQLFHISMVDERMK